MQDTAPPSSVGPMSIPAHAVRVGGGPERSGLVLSGGGMRGAYEAGVVAGIVEALGLRAGDRPPFGIFAGTSVGAINAAYYATWAHRGDLNAEGLCEVYRNLQLGTHLRLSARFLLPGAELLRRWRVRRTNVPSDFAGHSILDPRPLEGLVREALAWDRLGDNVASGRVRSLIVAALNVATGRTTLFAHLAPGATFRASKDPRRTAHVEPITPEHVLASAAIPIIFPARRVGSAYYSDGGLRFNTPISPAIRSGAGRLVVISLLSNRELPPDDPDLADRYPSPAFLAGKLLNALLLDPVVYDLMVLERLNSFMEGLETALTPDALAALQHKLVRDRGAPYRRIQTLVFRPTRDIGRIAGRHLRHLVSRNDFSSVIRHWLDGRPPQSSFVEADLASYLLFEGGFASELVELGRSDALARAEEVRAFFATPAPAPAFADETLE